MDTAGIGDNSNSTVSSGVIAVTMADAAHERQGAATAARPRAAGIATVVVSTGDPINDDKSRPIADLLNHNSSNGYSYFGSANGTVSDVELVDAGRQSRILITMRDNFVNISEFCGPGTFALRSQHGYYIIFTTKGARTEQNRDYLTTNAH